MLRIFIVFMIWGSVWHYMQPKNRGNRVLRVLVLVVVLLFAASLISMTT